MTRSNLPGIGAMVSNGPAHEALTVFMTAKRAEAGHRATADGTYLRGSTALDCARKIAFEALQIEPVVPLPTGQLVVFEVGQQYHDVIQAALVAEHGAQLEVVCSWYPDYHLSSHADAVYPLHSGARVAVEIKSAKAFAWDLVVGGNKYDHIGPGPKREHLVQAGISALAPGIDAEYVHLIYVNKDTGELAEWMLGVHTPLEHLGGQVTVASMVRDELLRQDAILRGLQAGIMPERAIPGFGTVTTRPPKANSKDKPWNCRYCGWQPICANQPHGEFALADIDVALPELRRAA